MVPTPLILLVLLISFLPAMMAYFVSWPKRRMANPFFAMLASDVALMLVVLILALVGVQIVWLSWAFLAASILLVPMSVTLYRSARTIERARERQISQRRARGG